MWMYSYRIGFFRDAELHLKKKVRGWAAKRLRDKNIPRNKSSTIPVEVIAAQYSINLFVSPLIIYWCLAPATFIFYPTYNRSESAKQYTANLDHCEVLQKWTECLHQNWPKTWRYNLLFSPTEDYR